MQISMPRTRVRHLLFSMLALSMLALATLVPAPAVAQDPWPVSIEASAGATRGYSNASGSYRGQPTGSMAAIRIGMPLHPRDRAGAFIALDATALGVNQTRLGDCIAAPGGGCVPYFPGMLAVSALGGWESRSTRLRVLGGPAIVSADYVEAAGFTGRADLALPTFWRLSLTGNVSTLFVPSWQGDRFLYLTGGLGMRLR